MSLSDPLQQVDRTYVLHRKRKLSYFGGCDYFRLSSHPEVLQAAKSALDEFGLNVAASRSTTGNHALFGALEEALAEFFKAEAALLVAAGYASNLVVAQALAGQFECALVDERSHPSVKDALVLLGAQVVTFRHRDVKDFAACVKRVRGAAMLITDGMFSHDGSAAPLREYLELLPKSACAIVDDAHGAGVLGSDGRGTVEHAGVDRTRVIQTISLSKAFGAYGGAVLCSTAQREQIIARSRLFNGNTPLPLPLANAALTGVRLLKRNKAWRTRMDANAKLVRDRLRAAGIAAADEPGPIVPMVPRNAAHARAVKKSLLAHDVFPSLIRYSGGPPDGYFRFMISSEHSAEQSAALAEALVAAA